MKRNIDFSFGTQVQRRNDLFQIIHFTCFIFNEFDKHKLYLYVIISSMYKTVFLRKRSLSLFHSFGRSIKRFLI